MDRPSEQWTTEHGRKKSFVDMATRSAAPPANGNVIEVEALGMAADYELYQVTQATRVTQTSTVTGKGLQNPDPDHGIFHEQVKLLNNSEVD